MSVCASVNSNVIYSLKLTRELSENQNNKLIHNIKHLNIKDKASKRSNCKAFYHLPFDFVDFHIAHRVHAMRHGKWHESYAPLWAKWTSQAKLRMGMEISTSSHLLTYNSYTLAFFSKYFKSLISF